MGQDGQVQGREVHARGLPVRPDDQPLHLPCREEALLDRASLHDERPGTPKFQGAKRDCVPCPLRDRCLRHPERTPTRQVAFFAKNQASPIELTERMKAAIDSARGRALYGRRIATVEPVFANLRHNKRLDRFTLRSRPKVNTQWHLYCWFTTSRSWRIMDMRDRKGKRGAPPLLRPSPQSRPTTCDFRSYSDDAFRTASKNGFLHSLVRRTMGIEREKMLAGELYDPLDPELKVGA